MLNSLFTWLDSHPGSYWLGALGTTAILLGVTGWEFFRESRTPAGRRAGWLFAGCLLLFLLAWRWPFLFCASEYNPDESQFIAGATALKHDPVFWRAADGATAGPLDFYAVLPLHMLGVPLDYFCIRVTGLLLTWLALLLGQRLLRTFTTSFVAQLAVLPSAFFFACATDPDFVHYASELVPMALMALAVYWHARRPAAAAFAAGCLPWAKLQAIPLAGAFVAWQLWTAWRDSRRQGVSTVRPVAALAAGALAPSLFTLAALAIFGQLEHFFRRYLLQNLVYVGQGQPMRAVVRELARRARDDGQFTLWVVVTGLFLAGAIVVYARQRQRPSAPFWLGAGLLTVAAVCILVPARTTLHYVLLLIVPAVLCTGAALGDLWPQVRLRPVLAGLLGLGVLLPLGLRLRQPAPHMFGQFAEHWRRPYTALGTVLRHWRQPGARLTLWGWRSSVYVEAGMTQATRDTVSGWCISESPQRDYYRASYLSELERTQPEVFVDAVGRDATAFNQRSTQGHEIFPALAAYVSGNYSLVTDLQGPRVYVRNDFLAAHPLTTSDLERLVAKGRVEYDEPVAPMTDARVQSRVDGRIVQMLEPPSELLWRLDGTERSARLDLGFHPRAYLEGQSDGAEAIAELRMPGQPPLEIFRRLLDPAHQSADRGPQSVEVVLPPFPAGTTFAIRTTPGKAGNAAWDWIYFDQLRFAHSPFYLPRQFPGFHRVPSQVTAAYPYLVRQGTDWLMMLPPPAGLTFVLDGTERQLSFSYGLAEGAYTNGGATDGAIYRVELQRDGSAPRVLFENRLDPVAIAAHRGTQHADLMLPADLRPEDRIVLQIDAGGSNSWDWTYIADLDLH